MKAIAIRWTIARRIGLAFAATGVIALTLGAVTVISLNRAGDLVAKSFDESVVTTNFVRATADDFARMRSEFADSGHAKSGPVAVLERSLRYDLATTLDKLPTDAMTQAGAAISSASALWMAKAAAIEAKGAGTPADKTELNEIGHRIDDKIEAMINIVGQTAFDYRQSASSMVARDAIGAVGLAGAAVVILSIAALMLWRGITAPLHDAVRFAEDIARGRLDADAPTPRDDEIGTLIGTMGAMRNHIGTMMQEQIVLRESSQARISEALESSSEGIIVADGRGTVQIANGRALEFLGLPSSPRPIGLAIDAIRKRVGSDQGRLALIETTDLDRGSDTRETLLSDGRRIQNSRSRTSEGGFVGLYADITVLAEQKASLDSALANMTQGLCVFDPNRCLKLANRHFFSMLGIDAAPPSTPYETLLVLSVAQGNHPQVDADRLRRHLGLLFACRHRTRRFVPFRHDRILAATLDPMPGGGWLLMLEDVTAQRNAEHRIAHLANHDAVTGLPNRTMLARRVEEAISRSRPGLGFAVLCIDLDRFKDVNDTLGHATGDLLLAAVADRLMLITGKLGIVARLGGDEFAILQTSVGEPQQAEALAARVIAALEAPFEVDGHTLWIGASLGVAIAPQHGATYGDLLKNADVALYQSKDAGRGVFTCFTLELDEKLKARRALQNDLKQAVARGELDLAYQPLLDLASLEICSFEALVRWRHPVRGLVMPGDFISIAEEMGTISSIGAWVLAEACRQAMTWPDTIVVAVNVSVVQLRNAAFATMVKDLLAATGLPPHRLELEVTESVFMSSNAKALLNLGALKQHGVRFAVDDFGTGYSSLSYLRGFAFDKIKIDRSFLKAMLETVDAEQIVKTVIGLGKNLGMIVVAEGVETPKQMQRLQQLGCDQIQGYLIGRPMPPDRIADTLAQHNGPSGSGRRAA